MVFGFVYPLVDAFWTILWIFAFILWIWLLFAIIADLFRDHQQSGWAKAIWVILLLFFPLFGALGYLILRGGGMHERAARSARAADEQFRAYVRESAGNGGTSKADELEKLARLRDQGVLTPEEYEREKAKLLA
jgi:Short C-terminal domain/Phospholipase_D-nuclease N-terminal